MYWPIDKPRCALSLREHKYKDIRHIINWLLPNIRFSPQYNATILVRLSISVWCHGSDDGATALAQAAQASGLATEGKFGGISSTGKFVIP